MRRKTILRMARNSKFLAVMCAVMLSVGNMAQAQTKAPKMTKQERVCLRNGNKLYEKKR